MSVDFWKKEMKRITDNQEVLSANKVLRISDKDIEPIPTSESIGAIYGLDGKFLGRIGTSDAIRKINLNLYFSNMFDIFDIGDRDDIFDIDDTDIINDKCSEVIKLANEAWARGDTSTYISKCKMITKNSSAHKERMGNKEFNVRAFLYMLRIAEGHGKLNPYNIMYGGSTIEPEKRNGDATAVLYHPLKLVTKWNKTSSAAGAYGWLRTYWPDMKSTYGYPNFEGRYQDAATVEVFRSDGLLDDIGSGEWNKVYAAMLALNKRWPSLPRGGQQGIDKNSARKHLQKGRILEWYSSSALAAPKGFLNIGR